MINMQTDILSRVVSCQASKQRVPNRPDSYAPTFHTPFVDPDAVECMDALAVWVCRAAEHPEVWTESSQKILLTQSESYESQNSS